MGRDKKPRREADKAQLEMTPMIDVVFQLLIFFIVTLKSEDIMARLEVMRPAPEVAPPKIENPDDLLQIQVWKEPTYVLRGREYSLKSMDQHLRKVAGYSKNVTVIIKCTKDSPHRYLVDLLDLCAKHKLNKLAVFSM
jgi:biopolymer transport protein ExbD